MKIKWNKKGSIRGALFFLIIFLFCEVLLLWAWVNAIHSFIYYVFYSWISWNATIFALLCIIIIPLISIIVLIHLVIFLQFAGIEGLIIGNFKLILHPGGMSILRSEGIEEDEEEKKEEEDNNNDDDKIS